jgi:hypothetical protein
MQIERACPGILGACPAARESFPASASNNPMNVMATVQPGTSSPAHESALFETVRRVNAEALSLLTRRSEINRRIRGLHRLMHGLRDLAAKTDSSRGDRSTHLNSAGQPCGEKTASLPTCCGNVLLERKVSEKQPLPLGGSKNPLGQLRRACRIALMEAGGTASLDEIRSRIVRRGSFSFPDSGLSESVIVQTLDSMAASAEVRCQQNGAQLVWQRIVRAGEIDLFQQISTPRSDVFRAPYRD